MGIFASKAKTQSNLEQGQDSSKGSFFSWGDGGKSNDISASIITSDQTNNNNGGGGLGKAFGSIGERFMNAWGHGGKRVNPMDSDAEHPLIVASSGDSKGGFFGRSSSVSNNSNSALLNYKMNSIGNLQIQKPAPNWTGTAVVDGEFKEISLDDYKGKYLVFFFYPLDFTFVCPTEIIAFSDRIAEFREIGCEVVACSTDSHFCHFAWVSQSRKQGGLGPMDIPLLADKTGVISKAYGVLKEDSGIAFRGLFIIDGMQNLRQITINDLPVGRSVDETLRLVQAFQFTDKHGEVCPAGWKPGQKTIKPTIDDSKEYFEAA